MKWRIFVEDVGKDRYSGFLDISANSLADAKRKTNRALGNREVNAVTLPHTRKDWWPDKTGRLGWEKQGCPPVHDYEPPL